MMLVVIIVAVVLCTCQYSSSFCIAVGIVVAVIPSEDIDGMQCSVKEFMRTVRFQLVKLAVPCFCWESSSCYSSFKAMGITDYPMTCGAMQPAFQNISLKPPPRSFLKNSIMFLIFRPSLTPKSQFGTSQD